MSPQICTGGGSVYFVVASIISGLHPERFRDANSGYSGYKSAHVHKCTRVVQSRTFRVINKMATSYGYGWKQTALVNETRYSLKL